MHAWSIDDTGMLDTTGLASSNDIDVLEQEIMECSSITITAPEEVLQVHSYAPPKKAEGTACLVYENVNGLSNCLCGNKKVDRMKELHNELEVDMVAYCRHKLNMKHKKNVNGFNQLIWRNLVRLPSPTRINLEKPGRLPSSTRISLKEPGRLTSPTRINLGESGRLPSPTRINLISVILSVSPSLRAKRGIWRKRVFTRKIGNFSFCVH